MRSISGNSNSSFNKSESLPNNTDEEMYISHMVSANIVCSFIGIIGTVENIFLFMVVVRQIKSQNSGSQILVANLLFTYIMASIYFGSQALQIGSAIIPMTFSLCRARAFFLSAACAAGMWTDALLGFNRVVAIFRPHQFSKIVVNYINYALVVVCWLLSIVLVAFTVSDSDGYQIWWSS